MTWRHRCGLYTDKLSSFQALEQMRINGSSPSVPYRVSDITRQETETMGTKTSLPTFHMSIIVKSEELTNVRVII